MTIRSFLFMALALCFISCRGPVSPSITPAFARILPDTANNRRAKWELESLTHYNNLCKAMGIARLYDGADSLEVRVWRQFSFFGMAADEEIYSLKLRDSTVDLTFYRVYCTNNNDQNFRDWNAYADPRIDSFFAVSKSFPRKMADSLWLQGIWELKTQSALHIADSIGFLDGNRTSIEIASKTKYKLITHHVAEAYYDETKRKEIKQYMEYRDKLIILFQSNRVYDHP